MKHIKLKEQERIVDEIRQYGLTLILPVMVGLFFVFCAAFLMFYLLEQGSWGPVVFAMLLTIGLFVLLRTYILWRKNVFYITTHRIIDVEQQGFFHRTVSDVNYEKIEDVSGNMKGIMRTIFRFGMLTIHTSNEKVKIVLPAIKRPLQVQQYINEMRDRYLQKYAHAYSDDVAGSIIDKLYELELSELRRVEKTVRTRIHKLSQSKN